MDDVDDDTWLDDDTWMDDDTESIIDPFEEVRSNDYIPRADSRGIQATSDTQPSEVDEQTVSEVLVRETARRFAMCAGAVYTASVIATAMPGLNDPEVMMHYLNQMAVDANAQSDPLLRMLMDQIAIMFHRLGALHSSSANAKTPEAVVAFSAAAARLNTELRKSMLTLRELQAISMQSATYKTVVKPQAPAALPDTKEKIVTELGSNVETKPLNLKELDNANRNSDNSEEKREAGRGRAPESAKESRAHNIRTGQTTDHDSVKQTMAALNRACHAGW